jgi:hypothetical protein
MIFKTNVHHSPFEKRMVIFLLITTQIEQFVMARMSLIEESFHILQFVSIHTFYRLCWITHSYYVTGYVTQVKVETIQLCSSFVLAHHSFDYVSTRFLYRLI